MKLITISGSVRQTLLCLPVIFFMMIVMPGAVSAQQIVINEVMASNASTIADEDGDYEDWIEIYNRGDAAVDLFGWGLSDDYGNPFRWLFPDVTLQPGGFLLVWASGKNRTQADQPLHTNFSISQAGEEVLITRPDGVREDELTPLPIPTDFSYGRKPDGADQWFYFAEPTPGNANATNGYNGFTAPPEILVQHVEDRTFRVEINQNDSDAAIYYTTDCSEPDACSLIYNEPFYFQAPPDSVMFIPTNPVEAAQNGFGWQTPVGVFMPAVVVRAIAVKDSLIASPITTKTGIAATYDLPVVSVVSDAANLFSDSIGLYVPGDIYHSYGWNDNDWWGRPNANYHQRGDEWERPGNFEIIFPDGSRTSQGIGLRIHGGGSRAQPLKSFRLYARNRYGSDTISANVMSDQPEAYRRLILRNSGQDYLNTMFRDAAIQAIFEDFNFDTQAYSPAVSFVNGEYWGVINIRERYDKYYLERVYGIDPDNIDYLTGKDEVKEGDNLHYIAMLDYIEEHGLESDTHYSFIKTQMDLENFIDYQIANIFANNTDWPGNNIDFWRLRTSFYQPNSPYGHDGRWRWMLYDTDFGFGLSGGSSAYHSNTLIFATDEDGPSWPNPPWSTSLLRSCLENQDFRHAFINRFADLLNTVLSAERTTEIILSMKNRIEEEIEDHFARWGYPDHKNAWEDNVGVMLEFANNRPFYQKKHIESFFDLDGAIEVQLDVENQLNGYIRINTIEIHPATPGVTEHPYLWTGTYFCDVPLEVEAIPAPGYAFSHWEGSSGSTSPLIQLDGMESVNLKAFFNRTDEELLMHYWVFDTSIPNNTPLEHLDASYSVLPDAGHIDYHSSLEGYPFSPEHPNWRKASMERRNSPISFNYRPEGNNNIPYGNANLRGLQVRQPFQHDGNENAMILHLPTTGFSDIVFRFAARDEGAADRLILDYATDENQDWTTSGMPTYELSLQSWYELYEVDFSDVPGVSNNPHFQVRIRFDGDHMTADNGDRVTFNNISLDGVVLDAFNIHASSGSNGILMPSGKVPVYQNGNKDFYIIPNANHKIADVIVDGQSTIDQLVMKGDTAVYSFANVVSDHTLKVSFRLDESFFDDGEKVILYPNPAATRTSVAAYDVINRIELINLSGSILKSYKGVGSRCFDLYLNDVRNGLYLITVYTDQGHYTRKLSVIR